MNMKNSKWNDYRLVTEDGTWCLRKYPSADNEARFSFSLPLPAGVCLGQYLKQTLNPKLSDKDYIWTYDDWKEQNIRSQFGVIDGCGVIMSVDDGKRMIDTVRSLPEELHTLDNWELTQTIAARPEYLQDECKVYYLKDGRGAYTLFVSDDSVHLTFSGSNATSWDNLLIISSETSSYDYKQRIPYFWPEPLQSNFKSVAIHLAIEMQREYTNGGWTKGRKRKYIPRTYE